VLTRPTTPRAAVGQRSSGTNRGRSPPRSPGSPDRSNAADAGGSSCHPDDLPKGYHTASRGAATSKSRSRVDPLTQRGRALPGRRDRTKAHHLKKATPHDHLDTFRSLNDARTTPNDRKHQACAITKNRGHHIYQQPTKQQSENQRVWGHRSLGRRSSTPRHRSQRRLTASRRDGASATIDTDDATSKAARTRERRRTRDMSLGVPFCTGNQPHSAPGLHLDHSGERETQCEMTASPAVDDRHETARQMVDTVCY
jgi:hypothetical protein